jgi:hypothetical protein
VIKNCFLGCGPKYQTLVNVSKITDVEKMLFKQAFDYSAIEKFNFNLADMGLSGQSLLGLNLDGRQSRASRRSTGFQRSTRSLSRAPPASSHLVTI